MLVDKNNKYVKANGNREMENICCKQLTGLCFITKTRKNINLVQKIKILQEYIIKKVIIILMMIILELFLLIQDCPQSPS